ncbi:hypothetical protein BVER_05703 [Candidatus Burkholderia verschuerenii]|uniref:Gag-asp_proteas domain-containing protein n=1 Tax=Candidatus Burkholderia verschuerenii TaxID=242163 RepID=A0A0L0LYI5_9BURK|nr:retropepsin-like aspartic protease [Candidatus Burkholderia verschuerenii]KND55071.1 hypothetical protein BVER_05703 [Candidatus Burkholderia verschuerenii]
MCAVHLRSGKKLQGESSKAQDNKDKEKVGTQALADKKCHIEGKVNDEVVVTLEKEGGEAQPNKRKRDEKEVVHECEKPKLPYTIARKDKLQGDKLMERLVELMKKINLNISFLDLICDVPKYAKCLKDIVANNEKFQGEGIVQLSQSCSSIFKNDMRLPKKMKDPGCCTIPLNIGNNLVKKALCDPGAAVNLMPLSIVRTLEKDSLMGKTPVLIQLADMTVVNPCGMIEDMLVQLDKFIIPVDFIVLDMEEDHETPLILGRPFLATCDATLRV